jgi:hypothetical protein
MTMPMVQERRTLPRIVVPPVRLLPGDEGMMPETFYQAALRRLQESRNAPRVLVEGSNDAPDWGTVIGSALGKVGASLAERRFSNSGLTPPKVAGAARALPGVLGPGVKFYDEPVDWEAQREAAKVKIPGRAGEELTRLGIDLNHGAHANKRSGEFRQLPSRVGSVVDNPVGFMGDDAGQKPEQLETVRREYERQLAAAVEAEMAKPGYAMFKSDAARRQYLQGVVATVRNKTIRGFNRETRGREIGELRRIRGMQENLERRSGTVGLRHMKL